LWVAFQAFVFTATADGEIEFVNQQILDYTGKTLEELKRWQAPGESGGIWRSDGNIKCLYAATC